MRCVTTFASIMLKALEKVSTPDIIQCNPLCQLFALVLMKERIRPRGPLNVSPDKTDSSPDSVFPGEARKKGSRLKACTYNSPWWRGCRWEPSRNSAATRCAHATRSAPAGRGRRAGRPCLRRPCTGSRICAAPNSSTPAASSSQPPRPKSLRGRRPSWPPAVLVPEPLGLPSRHLRTHKKKHCQMLIPN